MDFVVRLVATLPKALAQSWNRITGAHGRGIPQSIG